MEAVRRMQFALLLISICQLVWGDVLMTSTKTAYNDSLTEEDWDTMTNVDYLFVPSTCQPFYINAIFRHGTRNPGGSDIESINALAGKMRRHVRNPDFAELNEWSPGYDMKAESALVAVGFAEQRELGERFGRRFAELLSGRDKGFFTSEKQRCIDSCGSFQQGLSDALGEDINADCEVRNDLLRFYDDCPFLDVSVEENKEALQEYDAFGEGPMMTSLVQNVTQLLDFDNGMTLSKEDLELLYTIMGYDIAGSGRSVLEDIMTEEQLQIMAFWKDIYYYWTNAYSYSINYEVACPLLSDVFKKLDAAILAESGGSSSHRAFFQFGHTGSVMRLSSLLGLNKGTYPLRRDNFRKDREFETSYKGPFSTNIAFAAYKCDKTRPIPSRDRARAPPGVVWPDQVSDYMVQLLYKEKPALFPFSSYHLLPLDDVTSVYGRYISQCDHESICRTCYGSSAIFHVQNPVYLIITLVFLFLNVIYPSFP